MPPGLSFQDRIEINLVANGVAQPIPFSTDYFAFHPDFFPYPGRPRARRPRRRHGLLRPPPAPPDQPPRRLGRLRRLPGRELLPRRRPRHPLRPLRPRPRRRHRRPRAGRVPDLHRLLDPRAAARRPRPAPQRAPRQRLRRRRLRLRHRARRPHGDDDPLGALPPPRDQGHRHRAPDLDVLLRPRAPRRRRRLPRRGARQRRPPDRQRLRRAAVAAAPQPLGARDLRLLRRQPARLRPHPARPRLRPLRGRRGPLRAPPQRLDRARRALGQGRGHPGRDPFRRRVHRQHRRLLAPGRAARRRQRAPLRLPPDLGRGRRRRPAASPG